MQVSRIDESFMWNMWLETIKSTTTVFTCHSQYNYLLVSPIIHQWRYETVLRETCCHISVYTIPCISVVLQLQRTTYCVLFKKNLTNAIFGTVNKFKKHLFAPLRSINYLLLFSFLMAKCVTRRTVTLIMPTRDIK
jgi:hypothetical protein